MHTCMMTHTHTCAHTHTHACTHERMHTHTRMHARTHARTHTHTHAPIRVRSVFYDDELEFGQAAQRNAVRARHKSQQLLLLRLRELADNLPEVAESAREEEDHRVLCVTLGGAYSSE